MKFKYFLRVLSLLVMLASFVPMNHAALAAPALPPLDMFQLPWEQGLAWVAIDGLDNGTKRPLTSSHHYTVGGAIDFAPHNNMVKGEDTSNFWVTAAAAGIVVGISSCHMIIAHADGWLTQYQFLANIQVNLGDSVGGNQRLGIIADGVRQQFCPGSLEPNVPHLHFMLRPTIIGATFAGWLVKYNSLFNSTAFTKDGVTVGLFKPLLNVPSLPPTPSPTPAATTPAPTATSTAPSGPFVSTVVNLPNINVDETALVTVSLNNVPPNEYTSAEFTCTYDANLVEASNIVVTSLFGADAVSAINGPQNGSFIVAIAGSHGNKATTSGIAFTFNVKGLQASQTALECRARVSNGNNVLTDISYTTAFITIVGSTPTLDLTPSATPDLTRSTPTVLPSACDKAEFIADINIPPGTVMTPGTNFTKTWRLKNLGPCIWSTSYQLVFFYGEQMGAVSSVAFPVNVLAGQTVDVSINMTAPNAPGSYRGYWMFRNSNGMNFGIGPDANQPWFVDINVSGPTLPPSPTSPSPTITRSPPSPTPTITPAGPTNSPTPSITPGGPIATPVASVAYDFAANACAASWFSGAGQLPCPGIDGDPKGFVLKLNNPILETGVTDTRPGLLTFPQNVQNGYIQGFYPAFHVQNGDRFRSIINCEFGATNCYIAFRLDYQTGSDPVKTFWGPFLERYDGKYYSVDVDLSLLAGKDVKFILTLLSAGSPTGDRALWVGPIISRASASDWLTFTNITYGFEFKYPPQGQIVAGGNDNFTRIDLPFVQGTNLREKYLEVVVAENVNPCQSPLPTPNPSETITINGISFLKQTGADGGAGHLHQWVAYSTLRDNACVSLDFILHSLNAGNFPTPPPVLDFSAESAVFEQIVATYMWLTLLPTATPTPFDLPTATPMQTSTPVESPTPTSTAIVTPTATQISGAVLTGQVIAVKVVTVRLYDPDENFVAAVNANPDGTFRFEVAAGTYTVVATANGFLRIQGSITLTDGDVRAMPVITLLAGDIDDNNEIDQFDAMSIGMSYNTDFPDAADLNGDGIINVLDLELLARNYRKTGPVVWE